MKLTNPSGEKLDVLIEGNQKSTKTIVFVFGFGNTIKKDASMFSSLTRFFQDKYRIIRFDYSGYGKSQGKKQDFNLKKQASDLHVILEYVKERYQGDTILISHSFGALVTLFLNPKSVSKTIFIAPSPTTKETIDTIKQNFKDKKGKYLPNGTSIYYHTSGSMSKLTPKFWKTLKDFKDTEALKKYALLTKLLVIKPLQEEIAIDKDHQRYLTNPKINFIRIKGNHNFTKTEDRQVLMGKIKNFLLDK